MIKNLTKAICIITLNICSCINKKENADYKLETTHVTPYTNSPGIIKLENSTDKKMLQTLYILCHLFPNDFLISYKGKNIYEHNLKIKKNIAKKFLDEVKNNKQFGDLHKFNGMTKSYAKTLLFENKDNERIEIVKIISDIIKKIRSGQQNTLTKKQANILKNYSIKNGQKSVSSIIYEIFKLTGKIADCNFIKDKSNENKIQISTHIWKLKSQNDQTSLVERIKNELYNKKIIDPPSVLIIHPTKQFNNPNENLMNFSINNKKLIFNSSNYVDKKLYSLAAFITQDYVYLRLDDKNKTTWYECSDNSVNKKNTQEIKNISKNGTTFFYITK